MPELTLWRGATAPTEHKLEETCRARRYDYTDPKHGEVFAFRTHCTCGAGMVHGILARQPLFGLTREEVVRQAAQEAIAEHAWRADAGKRARWPVFHGRTVIATGARATMPVWVVVPPERHWERQEQRAGEPARPVGGGNAVTITFDAVASKAKRRGLTLTKGMAPWGEVIYGLWTRDGHTVAPELFYLDEIAAYLEAEY